MSATAIHSAPQRIPKVRVITVATAAMFAACEEAVPIELDPPTLIATSGRT